MNHIYIGGYTKRVSKGIYHMTLENGVMSEAELVAEINNPTYLQVDAIHSMLYCNNSIEGGHAISCFRISPDGSLTKVSDSPSKYANACWLALDKVNERIYSTIYGDGVFEARTFDQVTGHIFNVDFSLKTQGGGPVKDRQDGSHLHIAYPYDDYIYICDLGSDKILVLDRKSLSLLHSIAVEPGCGPRHILFREHKAYVMTELNNKVIELDYDAESGMLRPVAYWPALPEGFDGLSQGAAIRSGADVLYVSNRGHNSITVFGLDENGSITGVIQNIPTGGNWCRDFNLTPDGKYLIAAHERSDNVSLFAVAEDGTLSPLPCDAVAPEGTCVAVL